MGPEYRRLRDDLMTSTLLLVTTAEMLVRTITDNGDKIPTHVKHQAAMVSTRLDSRDKAVAALLAYERTHGLI